MIYKISRVGILLVVVSICGCNNTGEFDKAKWMERGRDLNFPFRDKMLNNLTTTYKITGINLDSLTKMLGDPEIRVREKSIVGYQIIFELKDGSPIHIKNLELILDKDSNVKSFSIQEWRP
jgi:hypothetical protein